MLHMKSSSVAPSFKTTFREQLNLTASKVHIHSLYYNNTRGNPSIGLRRQFPSSPPLTVLVIPGVTLIIPSIGSKRCIHVSIFSPTHCVNNTRCNPIIPSIGSRRPRRCINNTRGNSIVPSSGFQCLSVPVV